MLKKRAQTYNDGICTVYKVGNVAEPGNMPKDGLTLRAGPLRYEERIVGMSRFWVAQQAQSRISRLIRTQRVRAVEESDVVIMEDGRQYRIKQLQYPPDVEPPSMDFSLERMEPAYPDARLASLSIGNLVLTPAFNMATFSFFATTTHESDIVSAAAVDAGAQIELTVNGIAHESGAAAEWNEGDNAVRITVTVPGISRTYTVTVTRTPAEG